MEGNADTSLPEKRQCYPVSIPSDPLHYNPLQYVVVILLIHVLEVPVAILERDHLLS